MGSSISQGSFEKVLNLIKLPFTKQSLTLTFKIVPRMYWTLVKQFWNISKAKETKDSGPEVKTLKSSFHLSPDCLQIILVL